MIKIKSLFRNLISSSLILLGLLGCSNESSQPDDSSETGLFQIGTEKIYDFSNDLVFDKTQVSDFKIEEDGSVSYIASGQYSGGGACFYIKSDQSIINIENYETVDLEYEYEPISGNWDTSSNPKWCFNVYSDDSSGFWNEGTTLQYFENNALSGSFTYSVDVGDSVEGDMKAFAIKLNTYNTVNDGDQNKKCKIRIKKVTFNKKEGAPEDTPTDDGLTDEERGEIVKITYESKDYTNDDSVAVTKPALVYLPAGFDAEDKTTKYPVLFLMHGIGGSESEWGMSTTGKGGKLKGIMDKAIAAGTVKKCIVVCPNGRSTTNYTDASMGNAASFYTFGSELRNDLLPYMQSNYNVDSDRKNIAMAGLSMGGMQTINIGLCECLDFISYFGAFSAAPTTNTASVIASKVAAFDAEYDIKYFYNICGTSDTTALSSASAAVDGLASSCDRLTDGSNFEWVTCDGSHDWPVWWKGFEAFIPIMFQENYEN
ncbi:MAG: hypothetical protein K5829_04850 [Treponema sp.]|nr:hypothetical protein [Treponema sp.]